MVQQGFGCMGISAFYGAPMPEADGVALLKDVFAEGVYKRRVKVRCGRAYFGLSLGTWNAFYENNRV
eukprot:389417-Pyramimonas_sp.AAC.2